MKVKQESRAKTVDPKRLTRSQTRLARLSTPTVVKKKADEDKSAKLDLLEHSTLVKQEKDVEAGKAILKIALAGSVIHGKISVY